MSVTDVASPSVVIAKPIFIPGFGMINRFDTTTDGEAASVALIAHTTI